MDVLGELLATRTKQTDDVTSTEVTPRIGLRLHVLSRMREEVTKERKPRFRLVMRDLLRVEWRNLSYSDDRADSSSLRVRNRFELQFPLTRPRVSDDGAVYLLGDAELFWTEDDLDERFVSKERVRGGIGYRASYAWRLEALYIWDRSRKALGDDLTTADHALDVRIKRVW